ncbi:MAG: hypothetical protein ACI9ES_003200 [Oceanospirillaceae bacterium]|jgi:hypothetical protein
MVIDAFGALGNLQVKAATEIYLMQSIYIQKMLHVSVQYEHSQIWLMTTYWCALYLGQRVSLHIDKQTLCTADWNVRQIAIKTFGKHRFQRAVDGLKNTVTRK